VWAVAEPTSANHPNVTAVSYLGTEYHVVDIMRSPWPTIPEGGKGLWTSHNTRRTFRMHNNFFFLRNFEEHKIQSSCRGIVLMYVERKVSWFATYLHKRRLKAWRWWLASKRSMFNWLLSRLFLPLDTITTRCQKCLSRVQDGEDNCQIQVYRFPWYSNVDAPRPRQCSVFTPAASILVLILGSWLAPAGFRTNRIVHVSRYAIYLWRNFLISFLLMLFGGQRRDKVWHGMLDSVGHIVGLVSHIRIPLTASAFQCKRWPCPSRPRQNLPAVSWIL